MESKNNPQGPQGDSCDGKKTKLCFAALNYVLNHVFYDFLKFMLGSLTWELLQVFKMKQSERQGTYDPRVK